MIARLKCCYSKPPLIFMKTKLPILLAFLSSLPCLPAVAQGTAFTYQGRLNNNGSPAAGSYDFRFRLAADPFANNYAGGNLFTNGVPVSAGLFTVTLDFDGVFNGSNYWLEIAVRTNGAGGYTTLSPLQPVTPTPYAIFAAGASNVLGIVPSSGLSGAYSSAVNLNNGGNQFSGTFNGEGSALSNVNAALLGGIGANGFWKTVGNDGTTPGGNFIGTTDDQPLELHVNGRRASRLEPTIDVGTTRSNLVNVVNGAAINVVAAGVRGATIGGGGAGFYDGISYTNSIAADLGTIAGGAGNTLEVFSDGSSIGGGSRNQILGSYNATIPGGVDNTIQVGAQSAVIAGGQGNQIATNAIASVIGGGWQNAIQTLAYNANVGGFNSTIAGGLGNIIGSPYATIGGGGYNTIGTNSNTGVISGGYANAIANETWDATIGGGSYHSIGTNAFYSTIGGGQANTVGNNALSSTIAGGLQNSIQPSAAYSAIGGGYFNSVSGVLGTVPGGDQNSAANNSFAAGHRAKALHTGAFVWGDSTEQDFTSTGPNQFLVRATGGVGVGTNNPSARLHVDGGGVTNIALRVANGGIAVSGAGVGTGTAAFIHVANSTNMLANYITTIYNPLCDGDPTAILIVTHHFSPPGVPGNYEAHPFSVWYAAPRWTIYNDDFASISNMSFNVLIIKK